MEIKKCFQINKHFIMILFFFCFMGCTYKGSIKSDLNINNNHNHKKYPLSVALVENKNNIMDVLHFSVDIYKQEIRIYPEIMRYIHLNLKRFFKNVQIVKANYSDDDFDLLIYPTIRGGGSVVGIGGTHAKLELTFIGRASDTHEDIFEIKESENLTVPVPAPSSLGYVLITAFTLGIAAPITVPLIRDDYGKIVTNELENIIQRVLEKSCNRIKNNYSLKRYISPWNNKKEKEAVDHSIPSKNKKEESINY